jgi:hypothetical protein
MVSAGGLDAIAGVSLTWRSETRRVTFVAISVVRCHRVMAMNLTVCQNIRRGRTKNK